MEGLAEKKKIFISAHPNDRYLYLDRIVDAINGIEGFEVLYNPIPNDKGPSIPDDIDTFVIVASLKYFVWTNSGYISEYFAAVRNGVNVIPILIESTPNVIDLVNMRCGKLQYIDAAESLDFALDTLKAYLMLDQRHVDDSLSSVFISYRRVDRELLRGLVDTIESFSCRKNINVWYDEVIAPGENYSKSITYQLKYCNLFILFITPRILEANNYVWRVEFKTAKRLRKRILAIEAEKTDRRKLFEMYGNLGHIVDIKQKGAIESVISEISAFHRLECEI